MTPAELDLALARFEEVAYQGDYSATVRANIVQKAPKDCRPALALMAIRDGIFPPPDAHDETGNPAHSAETLANFWGLSLEEAMEVFATVSQLLGKPIRSALLRYVH